MITDEIRTTLQRAGARCDAEGCWTLETPLGTRLDLSFPEDADDVYAETVVDELPDPAPVALYRELCAMNLMWRDLAGFTVALDGNRVVVQAREPMDRLADDDAFLAWLGNADVAVRNTRAAIYLRKDEVDDTAEVAANPETKGDL